jgi:hypothetical protein
LRSTAFDRLVVHLVRTQRSLRSGANKTSVRVTFSISLVMPKNKTYVLPVALPENVGTVGFFLNYFYFIFRTILLDFKLQNLNLRVV